MVAGLEVWENGVTGSVRALAPVLAAESASGQRPVREEPNEGFREQRGEAETTQAAGAPSCSPDVAVAGGAGLGQVRFKGAEHEAEVVLNADRGRHA